MLMYHWNLTTLSLFPAMFEYKCFDEKLTWHHARRRCQDLGGDLANIKTFEEKEQLRRSAKLISADSGVFWTGLNDIDKEGHFHRSDGSPVFFLRWEDFEPNNGGSNEHCVGIDMNKMRLNDFQCETSLVIACRFLK